MIGASGKQEATKTSDQETLYDRMLACERWRLGSMAPRHGASVDAGGREAGGPQRWKSSCGEEAHARRLTPVSGIKYRVSMTLIPMPPLFAFLVTLLLAFLVLMLVVFGRWCFGPSWWRGAGEPSLFDQRLGAVQAETAVLLRIIAANVSPGPGRAMAEQRIREAERFALRAIAEEATPVILDEMEPRPAPKQNPHALY